MRTDVPDTPDFTAELADRLVWEANRRTRPARRRRNRMPFSTMALRRLRAFSSSAGHVTLALVMSAAVLLMSPSPVHKEAVLPAISPAPRYGYLSQFGVPPENDPTRTITMARESGFEVDVISTYVPDRHADGEIIEMRHMATSVSTVPVDEPARGPLLIVIGFSVGYGDNTAD